MGDLTESEVCDRADVEPAFAPSHLDDPDVEAPGWTIAERREQLHDCRSGAA